VFDSAEASEPVEKLSRKPGSLICVTLGYNGRTLIIAINSLSCNYVLQTEHCRAQRFHFARDRISIILTDEPS
jgi:hypothetical protein